MKVKHLIEKLMKADPEAIVILEDNIDETDIPEFDDILATSSCNGKYVTLYFTDYYGVKNNETEL